MFYDKEIEILSEEGYLNDSGRWVDGEVVVIKSIECDVQPFSQKLAYREYQFDKEVKYRVFCDPCDSITLGTSVRYKGKDYSVVEIIDWTDFWVVLIDG